MLKTFSNSDWYSPSEFHTQFFEYLKATLAMPLIPSFTKLVLLYIIDTYASSYAIVSTFLQQQGEANYYTFLRYFLV